MAAALKDEAQTRTMLAELHQQIVASRDQRAVCDLLARYAALALSKPSLAAVGEMRPMTNTLLAIQQALQTENMMYTAISNILKTKHDVTKNSIQNIR
jgi:hypothetical protein